MDLQPLLKQFETYIEGCLTQPSIQMQHLSGAGATYQLEQKLCNNFGKKYAVTFCNATSALFALSVAIGIKSGEILTTPFTWGGSISPFIFCGSKIVFGAVENDTLNLDPLKLLPAVTNKTKVVLSTDFNGIPANSKAIKDFCSQNGLFYISDSAQSLGSKRDGMPAGFFADATVVSFSPGKSFFGGEGGAVLTDNSDLYEKLIWYSQHPSRQKKHFGLYGYNEYAPLNGRLNPLSAILINELFVQYERRINDYQAKCFEFVSQLNSQGLVTVPEQLLKIDGSTYFNLMFRISKKAHADVIDSYLKLTALPFFVEPMQPNIIPLDKTFRKQFKKRFVISKELNDQMAFFNTADWVKFNKSN
jgi:perosamine synthetase